MQFFVTSTTTLLLILHLVTSTKFRNVFKANMKDDQELGNEMTFNYLKEFQGLAPDPVDVNDINDEYLDELNNYFREVYVTIDKEVDPRERNNVKSAFSNIFGKSLRSNILPAVRTAYYGGYINYTKARRIHDFYAEVKMFLNTEGLDWLKPKHSKYNFEVKKIRLEELDNRTCLDLYVNNSKSGCVNVNVPVIAVDDKRIPDAIELPYKTGGFFSVFSKSSKDTLVEYYKKSVNCILKTSSNDCRVESLTNFNFKVWHWLKTEVESHLDDEVLYAAFGGVLRIAASIQNYGLSFKNIKRSSDSKRSIRIKKETDLGSSPLAIIFMIVSSAGLFYIVKTAYDCFFGDALRQMISLVCNNNESKTSRPTPIVAFRKKPSEMHRKSRTSLEKQKLPSNQRVYDLNEEKEKFMIVEMTECSSSSSDTASDIAEIYPCERNHKTVRYTKSRHSSPPKIQTRVSQKRISKNSLKGPRPSQFSKYSSAYSSNEEEISQPNVETNDVSTTMEPLPLKKSSSFGLSMKTDLEWAKRALWRNKKRRFIRIPPKR